MHLILWHAFRCRTQERLTTKLRPTRPTQWSLCLKGAWLWYRYVLRPKSMDLAFFIARAHFSRVTFAFGRPPRPTPLPALAVPRAAAAPMLFNAVSTSCSIARARITAATPAWRKGAATTGSPKRATRAWHPHLCTSASFGHAASAARTTCACVRTRESAILRSPTIGNKLLKGEDTLCDGLPEGRQEHEQKIWDHICTYFATYVMMEASMYNLSFGYILTATSRTVGSDAPVSRPVVSQRLDRRCLDRPDLPGPCNPPTDDFPTLDELACLSPRVLRTGKILRGQATRWSCARAEESIFFPR